MDSNMLLQGNLCAVPQTLAMAIWVERSVPNGFWQTVVWSEILRQASTDSGHRRVDQVPM